MKDIVDTSNLFFEFSNAYLMAASVIVNHVINSPPINMDVAGSACMFNARLGVELFLKGAIVLKNPSARLTLHHLEYLRNEYRSLYSDPKYHWDVPFTVQFIGDSESESKREKDLEKHLRERPLDQVFRYPIDNKGRPWERVSGFQQIWFRDFIAQIISDVQRLKKEITADAVNVV
jgi:hypothetical protein